MKTKKNIKKSTFVADNPEQESAIVSIRNFIDHGNPDEWLTLQGKAGTGKTTIIQEAIEPYIMDREIIIGALSHKAKIVLAKKLQARFGRRAIQEETLASMLGMSMDQETGRFVIDRYENTDAPIQYCDIIIIDEGSMINEEGLDNVMKMKPSSCKVIFAGDIGQLPPIREKKYGNEADHASPTFDTRNKATLLKRVRQGEESPILPYADFFWNNSQLKYPVLNPADESARVSTITEKGSLIFSKSKDAIEGIIHLYDEAVQSGNQDIVRTISYRNSIRQNINNRIRKFLFKGDAINQLVPGELIVFGDNYGIGQDKISNSTEAQVKTVKESCIDGWNIFEIGLSINGKPRELHVLNFEEADRFSRHLQYLANRAKAKPIGPIRSKAWKDFYGMKDRFAPIEYAYAITSHKAQGSTYDVSLIAEADVMAVQATSNKSKSQSIYTGITRSKHLSIIMDGVTDHQNIDKAIEVLKIQRNG